MHDAPAIATGGCGRWVTLQHVQHPDLQHMSETVETLVIHMKTLAKTSETLESTCVAIAKHMQHPDETLETNA
jgi:hypothetical protein